ncbi:pentatricopeptide repeat-containing protein At2g22410, mitochondrial-like [Tripterygium wilfordii]|uniref:pentatricopeptide repeat-containing protein At2g22410, mitochondrial-like n=1 Tax=Tripterygium wilfordii TaxID=458696 RepID=UPI0018F8380E|nr:pentatricopeptide repeat-containing protein At2g22410, mitochondrial-like [Tripterygium wilfordii]
MFSMKRPVLENSFLVSLLDSFIQIEQALQIHAQFIVNGFHRHIFPISRLISFFVQLGSTEGLSYSHLLFSQTASPNVFIWNTLIRGYSRSNSPQEAIFLYMSMLAKGIESPNNFTFPFLLNGCARLSCLKPGWQIHGHVMKFGFKYDLFIGNSLIFLYSAFGHLEDARNVFDESPVRDLVSYNTLMNGYNRGNEPWAALRLLREMQESNVKPDGYTFVALLSAYSLLNNPMIVKQVHCLIYKNLGFFDSDVLLKSVMVDMYAKCGLMNMAERVFSTIRCSNNTASWSSMVSGYARCGEIEAARRLFDQSVERDVVSWTAMISGYVQAGQYKEALEIFVQMESLDIRPDEVTLVAVFSACAGLGALDFGKKLDHQYVRNDSYHENAIVTTSIIDMYGKCGSIDTALDTFHRSKDRLKTNAIFNSMITGLAKHGLGKIALDVFKEMELTGLKPDGVTFVAILSACSHSGLVEEGKKLFNSMLSDYGITPEMEHYGCMVDLLGRDGHLEEAYELIQNMQFEANSVIWIALLGACRLHKNAELGDFAARKLFEVEPDHGARYVLLSNMLANANQWEEAGRVREVMDESGIQKPPGWSYVELDGVLNRFLASDKSHPQAADVELMLMDLTRVAEVS